jgi:hypothetical protein
MDNHSLPWQSGNCYRLFAIARHICGLIAFALLFGQPSNQALHSDSSGNVACSSQVVARFRTATSKRDRYGYECRPTYNDVI